MSKLDEAQGKIARIMLERLKDHRPSPKVLSALKSDTRIAAMAANQLSKDLEASGKTHFTVSDIREAERKLFNGA